MPRTRLAGVRFDWKSTTTFLSQHTTFTEQSITFLLTVWTWKLWEWHLLFAASSKITFIPNSWTGEWYIWRSFGECISMFCLCYSTAKAYKHHSQRFHSNEMKAEKQKKAAAEWRIIWMNENQTGNTNGSRGWIKYFFICIAAAKRTFDRLVMFLVVLLTLFIHFFKCCCFRYAFFSFLLAFCWKFNRFFFH